MRVFGLEKLFKNSKLEWWKKREEKLLQEFSARESELKCQLESRIKSLVDELTPKQEDLERKKRDLEDLEKLRNSTSYKEIEEKDLVISLEELGI